MKVLRKMWKWAVLAVAALLMAALVATVSVQQRRIKDYRKEIDGQDVLIERLANMEAVRCEVSLHIKNTAVLGSTKGGDLQMDAKQIATYLRGEVLQNIISKKDSLWYR